VVSNLALDPSPNNGSSSQAGNLNFLDSLQVAAMLTDPAAPIASNIAGAEVFVTDITKTLLANPDLFLTGTGAEMIPATAKWGDAPAKQAYAYIPLAILTSYKDGVVRFWVHAQDTAGNWGDFTTVDMILDRTPPAFDKPPTPPAGTSVGSCSVSCSISYGATDPGPASTPPAVATNIISGEWYLGQSIVRLPGDDIATSNDPGLGKGIPFSVTAPGTTVTGSFQITPALIAQYLVSINATAATLPPGTTLNIVFRVRDAAGNWSKSTFVVGTA
jgi:fructose-specific component phosphotransferase system IIB-like protein